MPRRLLNFLVLLFVALLPVAPLTSAAVASGTDVSEKCMHWLTDEGTRQLDAARITTKIIEQAQDDIGIGLYINEDDNGAIAQTQRVMGTSIPVRIMNGAFSLDERTLRAHVLQRVKNNGPWNLTFIYPGKAPKNTKSLVYRVALVAMGIVKAGHRLGQITVRSINPEYRALVAGAPLFLDQDFTDAVKRLVAVLSKSQTDTKKIEIATEGELPPSGLDDGDDVQIDANDQIPLDSVLHLPWVAPKKRAQLMAEGYTDFSSVLAHYDRLGFTTKAPLRAMLQQVTEGRRFVDVSVIQQALSTWDLTRPLIYLDFETISPALPRYVGTAPYQQVPFQFSVDVATAGHSAQTHFEYLHNDATDPRPALIAALLQAVPKEGSVVAYNMSFESSRLKEMADAFPQYAAGLLQIRSRLVDPLPIMRKAVYDIKQRGSFSIKYVAPALLGEGASYNGMAVPNGTVAQQAYERLISGELNQAEHLELRQAMLEYCGKDTEQMRGVVEWLLVTARLR